MKLAEVAFDAVDGSSRHVSAMNAGAVEVSPSLGSNVGSWGAKEHAPSGGDPFLSTQSHFTGQLRTWPARWSGRRGSRYDAYLRRLAVW